MCVQSTNAHESACGWLRIRKLNREYCDHSALHIIPEVTCESMLIHYYYYYGYFAFAVNINRLMTPGQIGTLAYSQLTAHSIKYVIITRTIIIA